MIFVTGATGFVGKPLISELLAQGIALKALVRKQSGDLPDAIEQVVGVLEDLFDKDPVVFNTALQGVDVVIHLAGRVHVMKDKASDPLAEFRKINRDATLALARRAANAGVKRFVFLSSVKVNGETTSSHSGIGTTPDVFRPDDIHIPKDPYGLSKYEAEQGLQQLAKDTGMEIVIIRPPLIYGPGVKANFAAMMKWVSKGLPLPLGRVLNLRSFVALDNLIDFICLCIKHPKAANEIFLVSDGEDVSTTELLRKVANAFGKNARLIPVHPELMRFAAKLIGKGDVASRLFDSLQVDSTKAHDLLGWKPEVTMDEQLKNTVKACLNEKTV